MPIGGHEHLGSNWARIRREGQNQYSRTLNPAGNLECSLGPGTALGQIYLRLVARRRLGDIPREGGHLNFNYWGIQLLGKIDREAGRL
jgi:glucokinase